MTAGLTREGRLVRWVHVVRQLLHKKVQVSEDVVGNDASARPG